jgi:pyruvate kinase
MVDLVREVEQRVGRPLAIIGDLVGPSIRVGVLDNPILLSRGDRAVIEYAEKSSGGDERVVPLPVRRFFEILDEGDILIMDDGRVQLRIVEVRGLSATVEALTPAKITSNKVVVIRGKDPGLPSLTKRDLDAVRFAVENGLDYISLSYVRTADDISILKSYVYSHGGRQGIVAKIENMSAVQHLSEIVKHSDVVVVARGDLGMNYGLEEIPFLQEKIVETARQYGKPVIVATQLLESMLENPVPTRAEVTDVANAVCQGIDALMLTGETAIGRYPVEAVRWLKKIIVRAERSCLPRKYPPKERKWAYAFSIVETAENLGAKLVLIYSIGGTLPPHIAASRPRPRVLVGVPEVGLARKLSILWGLEPRVVEAKDYSEGLAGLESDACRRGDIAFGDTIIKAYRRHGGNIVEIKTVTECS